MKVLVLGGNGFIGSHVVDRLLADGHQVRVFDRHPEAYREPLEGVEYRYGSFDHRQDVEGLAEGMQVVIHLISTTHPKTSADDPAFDVSSNLLPTLGILHECLRSKVSKFAYVSSGGTVYGDPVRLPALEDDPTLPLGSYGATKLAIESFLRVFEHQFGLPYVVLRPSNAYGPRNNPAGIQGAIPVFLRHLGRGEAIELWGDGSTVRDYIYVSDLADGIVKAALHGAPGRVFNLGHGEGHSLLQVLAKAEAVTGLKAKVHQQPARLFDIAKIWLDISRAKAELQWQPQVSLESGIAKTWEFVKEHLA